MSDTFKFNTHFGTKQRIAHEVASSSLFKDLEHKKQSITQALSEKLSPKKKPQKQTAITAFLGKRRKVSKKGENYDDSDEFIDDIKEEKSSNSESDDNDDDLALGGTSSPWLSKTKPHPRNNNYPKSGPVIKSTACTDLLKPKEQHAIPPPPPMDFLAKKRAMFSSDEEEEGMDQEIKPCPAAKPITNNLKKPNETARPPPKSDCLAKKRAMLSSEDEEEEEAGQKNQKSETVNQTIVLSDDDEFCEVKRKPNDEIDEKLDEWLCSTSSVPMAERKSRREPKEKRPKKGTLKALKQKAKKLHRKNKHGGNGQEEGSDASGADSGMDHEDWQGSYDSDDSEFDDHMTAKQLEKARQIQQKCLEFMNNASSQELSEHEKLNEDFVKLILGNRPFQTYEELKAKVANESKGVKKRGAPIIILDAYLAWLEKRGVLDQILDDCRKHTKAIEQAIEEAKSKKSVETPALLNPDYSLHPYQLVGLNWLIMMHKLGLSAILADEMGLGKTIQVIAFLTWAKEKGIEGPHLIVVPSSTIENWMQEISRWSPSLRVLTYYGSIEERQQLRRSARKHRADIILTTYNMVISRAEDRQFFKKFSLNYVCYDEGHMLKNCTTQRYISLMRIHGKRKILLTGTPLQNNLVELFSLLYFTMRKLFDRYCEDINSLMGLFRLKGQLIKDNMHKRGVGAKKNDALGNEDDEEEAQEEMMEVEEQDEQRANCSLYEKHKIAQAKTILQPFVLRRLKVEVLSCLPKKHEQIRICEPIPVQVDIYAELLDELRVRRYSNDEFSNGVLDLLTRMRRVANHPLLARRHYDEGKIAAIANALCLKESYYQKKRADYLAEELAYKSDIALHLLCKKYQHTLGRFLLDERLALESGKCRMLDHLLPTIINEKKEKVLIFSQYTSLLDVLELYMAIRDYQFLRLDGQTPVLERQEMINLFNQDPTIPVFLLSTKAGGLGINLTAANHIIIHDIDMNPYNDKQAEDRCHRMGQTKEVHVTRMVCKNTIEEQMLILAKQKLELERDVTNNGGGGGDGNTQRNDVQNNAKKLVEELFRQTLTNLDKPLDSL